MRLLLVVFALVNTAFNLCEAYGRGAPASTCSTLMPGHGFPSSEDPFNYRLDSNLTTDKLTSKQPVLLTLSKSGETPFRGFIITAKDEQGQHVGRFQPLDENLAQPLDCGGVESSGVTHTSNADKDSMQFVWTMDTEGRSDDVVATFEYTVVEAADKYWVARRLEQTATVEAEPKSENEVDLDDEDEAYSDNNNMASPSSKPVRSEPYEGCSESRGCFGIPSGCVDTSDCSLMASYMPVNNRDIFELSLLRTDARNNVYVAMGFSADDKMGGELVFACTDKEEVSVTYNEGKSNKKGVTGIDIMETSFSIADDILTCSFRVPKKMQATLDNNQIELDLAKNHHVLIAKGVVTNTGDFSYHNSDRQASAASIELSAFTDIAGADYTLIKWHAILMLVAWMGAATSGMLIARYMRKDFTSKIIDKDAWFRCHQFFMGLAVLLSILGSVLILIDRGLTPLTNSQNLHPWLGLLVLILAVVQPIMAVFRPHPNDAGRNVFNWAHWGVGNLAFVAAVGALFLASELNAADFIPTDDMVLHMLVFSIVHTLVHLALSLHKCYLERDGAAVQAAEVVEMANGHQGPIKMGDGNKMDKHSIVRHVAFTFYVSFVWAISLRLVWLILVAEQGRDQW